MTLFIDSERAKNISIFRISFLDTCIKILELNEDILDQETVEKMVPNCPEPTDIAMVNAYDGEMKLLGKAEQYRLTTLIELPNLDVDLYRDNRTSFGACTLRLLLYACMRGQGTDY